MSHEEWQNGRIRFEIITEGIFSMLPSTLAARRFSPRLAPPLIAAGTPTLRPNPHSEAFLKILLEELNRSSRRNG